jgi:hypothetical protein
VPLRNVEQNKGGEPSTEKDFETQRSGVFTPPGLPLAHFEQMSCKDRRAERSDF